MPDRFARGDATSSKLTVVSTALLAKSLAPEKKRAASELFVEAFINRLARIDVEPDKDRSFEGELRAVQIGAVTCAALKFTTASMGRSKTRLLDGNDDIALIINRGPPLYIEGSGQRVATGVATLRDYARTSKVHCPEGADVLCFVLARKLVQIVAPSVEDKAGCVLPRTELQTLLRSYAEPLLANPTLQGWPTGFIGAHLVDLIGHALEEPNPETEPASTSKALRAHEITKTILQRLTDPDLTLAAIAQAHRMSERSVQLLLEEQDLTFTEFVIESRLALAHGLLQNPAYDHRTIAHIAVASGFGDLSNFNRAYRRRYGCTPSQTRALR